ncbi:hypothetical protein [Erysipelothrix aquatica]|uniref:hypothetical protein n=1 Tax=Erysipelothrix aquatica TaxID=2683714 RepID=UPI00135C893B|nr:hypothetical protein [Erysipelothrix aquatica]
MLTYNYYTDIQPLYEVPIFNQETIIASSESMENIESLWKEYMDDETVRRYKYTDREAGKKYEHRFGYTLTILLPQSILLESYSSIAHSVMNELLKTHKKVSWIAEATKQGEGTYITFTLCLAKRYKADKTVKVFYTHDVYKHKTKKHFIKEGHPDAYLTHKAGDLKSEIQTSWSNKIRLFEMEKKEFIDNFIPMLKRVVCRAINKVKKIKTGKYLKYIKHTLLANKKKTVYYNINVRYYNDFVADVNLKLRYWENAIYSGAKYYQEEDLIRDWNALKQRFIAYTRNRKFKLTTSGNRTIKLSLNPWINTVTFRENIQSIHELFDEQLDNILSKYISA